MRLILKDDWNGSRLVSKENSDGGSDQGFTDIEWEFTGCFQRFRTENLTIKNWNEAFSRSIVRGIEN
jgi:hypothetical protein